LGEGGKRKRRGVEGRIWDVKGERSILHTKESEMDSAARRQLALQGREGTQRCRDCLEKEEKELRIPPGRRGNGLFR